MASTTQPTMVSSKKAKEKQAESEMIVQNFQKLREEQRIVASKAAELQVDAKSHELVIDTLKEVDKSRKCYRMIGGVLVERTVAEVLPALEQNKDQISKLIEKFQEQVVTKGKEINDYREKYNIRFQGEAGDKQAGDKSSNKKIESNKSGGILVDK